MKKSFFLSALAFSLLGGWIAAQELVIDFQYNTARSDPANYLSFRTPIYLINVDKDSFDAVTGASRRRSTPLFGAFQMDMLGRATMPAGFRGLLLFAVAPEGTRLEDALRVSKAATGVITVEYVHRGVAYRIVTGRDGRIGFPRGNFSLRTIGYIQGHDPQVISRDFSPDLSSAGVDWQKVWDPNAPSNREIAPGVNTRTGAIQNDFGDYTAMYNWDGALRISFDNDILRISGSLKPVKR